MRLDLYFFYIRKDVGIFTTNGNMVLSLKEEVEISMEQMCMHVIVK